MGGKLKVEYIKIKGIFVSTCNTDAGFFPNPKSQNSLEYFVANNSTLKMCFVEWIVGSVEPKKKMRKKFFFFGECLVGRGRGKRNVRPTKKFFPQNGKEIRN